MSRNTTTAQFRSSKTLNNKYLLGDEIGKGAYGRVYMGLDLENGDFVAIKQVSLSNIPQEDLNSIMQEIDLLKNLNHKNIVQYRGSIKTKIYLYIILEYVENGSLASIVKPNKFGAFPESLVAVYIAQVLEGLVYLHEQGVIHRDIKGANILTTKEGLVKLADFGVATKLTEADVNTHSVVGTPYWMAPEVIEMSGVSAASDIWSVGCTVIELLTCFPPYYDLQPMPALFRIVQDEHPPIPEHLSPGLKDFLHQCFRKDAQLRPDAKTLLKHPWIQNSRRVLHSSLKNSGRIRIIPQDVSTVVERTIEDIESSSSGGNLQNIHLGVEYRDDSQPQVSDGFEVKHDGIHTSEDSNVSSELVNPDSTLAPLKDQESSNQELTFSISEMSVPLASAEHAKAPSEESANNHSFQFKDRSTSSQDVENAEMIAEQSGFNERHEDQEIKSNASNSNCTSHSHGRKAFTSEVELGKFSDTPADSSIEDLFEGHFNGNKDSAAEEALSEVKTNHERINLDENGKNGLAMKLKEKIAQWKTDIKTGRNGRYLSSTMAKDHIDIQTLDFKDKVAGADISPKQAVEISKLIIMLKPEESDDKILATCQKLVAIFQDYPDQKSAFVKQHGILLLAELLEIRSDRVILSVLEVLNQLIKDSASFQENACLVGLIPIIVNLTGPEHSYEIRMQTAFFVQQLCQSSSLTLQMFVACRGLPVLVSFLEPNYMKYRELVCLAVDCIWKVLSLQSSTSRNEFFRIFAKNGALLRLVNTLHSLNEATRLGPAASGGLPDVINDKIHQRSSSEPSRKSISESHSSQKSQEDILHKNGQSVPVSELAFVESIWHSTRQQTPPLLIVEEAEPVMSGQQEPSIDTDKSKKVISDEVKTVADSGSPSLQSSGGMGDSERSSHTEPVQPLLSLLEKEPPSRPISGQLDFVRGVSGGLEKQEVKMPFLHDSKKAKANSELELLLARLAETGREKEALELSSKLPSASKNADSFPVGSAIITADGTASTSGIASRPTSGLLSGSGLLNARPGSATSSGVLAHMVSALNADIEREYLEKVADLLLEFSQADPLVKSHLYSVSLLNRLMQMLGKLETPILLKILKCINRLSTDPNALEQMQRADAIKHLIPFLERHDGSLVFQVHVEVLNTLYNLCKINKRRQEQAAENGIIPHLMHFIVLDSPLKPVALPLLCDMAHASRSTREQLRIHNGLDIYLNLLDDDAWALTALDSLAVCLAHDNEHRKVELVLLKKEAVQKLIKFFRTCSEQSFVHILESFLKIITKSSRLNTALATNGLTPLLVARLDHQDAIVRLNILKLIKAVYEHHPRPKQMIVENDLPVKLQKLIQERRDGERMGGQVLVKQMATALLKALHINTVL